MISTPTPLNPSPVTQAAAFTPPPTGIVTIQAMLQSTVAYWKTIRIAWLSGYRINWMIPNREGGVGGSRSVWNLDVRIMPQETIMPARTARWTVEPYVLVGGRPYIEPPHGTKVTVKFTLAQPHSRMAEINATAAPTGLGETARWLPTPGSYTGGVWLPSGAIPPPPDAVIAWTAAEGNAPKIENEFTYAMRGEWPVVPAMAIRDSTYMRLDAMPLFSGTTPLPPVTLFVVAAFEVPIKFWASLLQAVEPDGSKPPAKTNLDLRLMPDGNLHPFTWGWQAPLPLVGENHALSLVGFTLDVAASTLRLFTIDRELRIVDMTLPYPHSSTSQFALGRNAEATLNAYVLDILFYRGQMDSDRIEDIANQLDAAYGITPGATQVPG